MTQFLAKKSAARGCVRVPFENQTSGGCKGGGPPLPLGGESREGAREAPPLWHEVA